MKLESEKEREIERAFEGGWERESGRHVEVAL